MVRNAQKIMFWTNIWCKGTPLTEQYLVLFNLAAEQRAVIAHICDDSYGRTSWNLNFIRGFTYRELVELEDLLERMNGLVTSWMTRNRYKISCRLNKNESFSVKLWVDGLKKKNERAVSIRSFFGKDIYLRGLASMCGRLAWRVMTMDNLKKRCTICK